MNVQNRSKNNILFKKIGLLVSIGLIKHTPPLRGEMRGFVFLYLLIYMSAGLFFLYIELMIVFVVGMSIIEMVKINTIKNIGGVMDWLTRRCLLDLFSFHNFLYYILYFTIFFIIYHYVTKKKTRESNKKNNWFVALYFYCVYYYYYIGALIIICVSLLFGKIVI